MGAWIDELLDELDSLMDWPRDEDADRWSEIAEYIALRESNRDELKRMAEWEDVDRRYFIDPVAPKISESFASLIYGEEPTFEAASPDDQPLLDDIVEGNRLGAELQRAVQTTSSEGEIWWRLYLDREVADVPLVDWHSRVGVCPLWVGRRLRSVAFVSRLDDLDDSGTVWRHFELHDFEDVQQVLYRSSNSRVLGDRVPLVQHPDTAELREEPWRHGLGRMMAGWIVNRDGVDPHRGVSDYHGVKDMLLELNETLTVGHENMKLTAKKRIVVPHSALDPNTGGLPDDDVIVDDQADRQMGEGGGRGPWQVMEYSFDAQALTDYRRSIAIDLLSRVGITAQFVGLPTDAEGLATSGTALRIRLIPSRNAGRDRAQHQDAAIPEILQLLQALDALPIADDGTGGFARPWRMPDEQPSMERGDELPEDQTEQSVRLIAEVEAKILSRRTAIQTAHPDWTEERVDEELKLIADDAQADAEAASTMFTAPADSGDAEDVVAPVGGGDAEGVGSNGTGQPQPAGAA
jgi:hypothetical protein